MKSSGANVYEQRLVTATLIYLLLPTFLFIAGWVRSLVAVPACLFLLQVGYSYLKDTPIRPVLIPPDNKWVWGLTLLATSWCLAAGLGEWTFQAGDFIKHNLIFSDLTRFNWPVVYPTVTNDFLCYYTAYYLPVALLGKLTSLSFVPVLSFVWSLAGLLLVFHWVIVIGGRNQWGALLGFVFFGGIKFWGIWNDLDHTSDSIASLARQFISKHEAVYYINDSYVLFPVNVIQWTWCPQHSLGGWLGMGLLYYELYLRRRVGSVLWIHALTLLYSPFVFVGLLPLLISKWPRRFSDYLTGTNLVGGGTVLLIIGTYFLAHRPVGIHEFLIPENAQSWLQLVVFALMEWGLYLVFLLYFQRRYVLLSPPLYKLLLSVSVSLALIPLFRLGLYNDFVTRVSLVPMALFAILTGLVGQQLLTRHKKYKRVWVFCGLLLLGAYVPVKEHLLWIGRKAFLNRPLVGINELSERGDVRYLNEYFFSSRKGYDIALQYLGDRDSFFGSYLVRHTQLPVAEKP